MSSSRQTKNSRVHFCLQVFLSIKPFSIDHISGEWCKQFFSHVDSDTFQIICNFRCSIEVDNGPIRFLWGRFFFRSVCVTSDRCLSSSEEIFSQIVEEKCCCWWIFGTSSMSNATQDHHTEHLSKSLVSLYTFKSSRIVTSTSDFIRFIVRSSSGLSSPCLCTRNSTCNRTMTVCRVRAKRTTSVNGAEFHQSLLTLCSTSNRFPYEIFFKSAHFYCYTRKCFEGGGHKPLQLFDSWSLERRKRIPRVQ